MTRSLTPESAPVNTVASVAYALRWPALFVVLAAEVMEVLDALITSIARPTFDRDGRARCHRAPRWV